MFRRREHYFKSETAKFIERILIEQAVRVIERSFLKDPKKPGVGSV
jgi:hypothetical protein